MDNRKQRTFIFRLTHLTWWIFGVFEGLIGLRVLLRLLGANPGAPFARFVYNLTDTLLWPFRSLTETPSAGEYVLDVSALIGMLVYALAGWALVRGITILFYTPPKTGHTRQPAPEKQK